MSAHDPLWKYTNSTETAKPGYLARKWDEKYPGWQQKPKKEEPVPVKPLIRLKTAA